ARFDEARAVSPEVVIAFVRFAEYVEARLPAELTDEDLHLDDLYLACGCALGDREANRLLDERILSQVPLMVARIDAAAPFGDEVAQAVRTKLLVGAGGRPAIGDYTGRGALKSWVHVAALRLALNLKRGGRPAGDLGDAEVEAILATPDPELQFVKHRARED